jgi:hypothetical protein
MAVGGVWSLLLSLIIQSSLQQPNLNPWCQGAVESARLAQVHLLPLAHHHRTLLDLRALPPTWFSRVSGLRALRPSSEDIDHLLATCPFAQEVWFLTLRRCSWNELTLLSVDALSTWWLQARKQVIKEHHKAFDSTVACVVWSLWLERNARVFRSTSNPAVTVTA